MGVGLPDEGNVGVMYDDSIIQDMACPQWSPGRPHALAGCAQPRGTHGPVPQTNNYQQ